MAVLALRDEIKKVTEDIDSIIDQCQPIVRGELAGIANSFVLAKGIYQLRELLYTDKNIKKTIEYMQDSKVGFMTDRSPTIIAKAKTKGKNILPYTYTEVADCVLNALLFGYNLFGKEFYIISGNFYPSQYGKYRHIMENKNISDFSYSNTPPVFKTEKRQKNGKTINVEFAEIECFAYWIRGGKDFYLGNHPDNKKKDPLVFKIKVDEYMGDDGVIGKALSKLFTRVLARLSCNYIAAPMLDVPESSTIETDIEDFDISSNNNESGVVIDLDMMMIIKSFEHNGINEENICAYFNVDDIVELNCPDGLAALTGVITSIEGGTMKKEEFYKTAAERKEIREKQI